MEPKTCSVLDCESRSDQGGEEEIYFYGFPRKPKYRKVWVAATGRAYWSAKRSSRICSKHFLPTCFAEGEGKSLLDDAVPTEFVKTRPPGSPMTVLSRLILEEYLERNNIDESAEVSESEVMNFVMKEFGEEYSEPEEMDEAAERPEPGFNYETARSPSEDQVDPGMVLRSTGASVSEPGTSSTVAEEEIHNEPGTTPPQSSTSEVTSPTEELTETLSLSSPTSPATPERHLAPETTNNSTTGSDDGSGSNFLPSWVRIRPERPARNPKEAGMTFRKKLFTFLRCPYNPLDIESDLRTLISLGVNIFILRRGNFRSVVNSLFRYLMKA